jgi:phosphomannomutase
MGLVKFMEINLTLLAREKKVKFGTSGVRALTSALTDKVCYSYTLAFLQYLETTGKIRPHQSVILAGDLRESTDSIAKVIYQAICDKNYKPLYCGKIPTPALCYYGLHKKFPGIMVTGSHIPENRNGIKFYTEEGEILKKDEQGIMAQTISLDESLFTSQEILKNPLLSSIPVDSTASDFYIKRYLNFFPEKALAGLKIGVYMHSSVAAPILVEILKKLSADVMVFGKSESFRSFDTEAMTEEDFTLANDFLKKNQLNAIVSTDADGDRPLITDEQGNWVRGDIVGMLCAIVLQAHYVVIPISCNSSVEQANLFKEVVKTKIGSPYVIEEINELIRVKKTKIMGYEANGGVLIGSEFVINGKSLAPLPTRDSIIPILGIFYHLNQEKIGITDLIKKYCVNFTASQSIKNFSIEKNKELLDFLQQPANIKKFFQINTPIKTIEYLDGIRIYFINGEILHLRPSGNAPELRCYTESNSADRAQQLSNYCFEAIKKWTEKKL